MTTTKCTVAAHCDGLQECSDKCSLLVEHLRIKSEAEKAAELARQIEYKQEEDLFFLKMELGL